MVRRVNFEPQQRVDQPDAQAISTYGVQDLRRVLRTVLMGHDAEAGGNGGSVLQGFAVEVTSPTSSRVVVNHVSAGKTGSFAGAIDNAGVTDWGQITGGTDGNGLLEGSAQAILDFAGQPTGLYDVKVRAVFAPGALDNRAFWNPATNTEFVKPTNTRLLPQWEIAYAGHGSPEWVLLAQVSWNGSFISPADVIDERRFPLEGLTRPGFPANQQFAHDTQNDGGTFGVGDFDRNTDRGTPGIGINALWAGFRALARQVQDVKGGRGDLSGDLRFDWYSRVFAAPGFVAADPTTKQTKSLRTVDVVTFTCGDGLSEQGDFNGADAVYQAFKFIEVHAAALPARIHILVKSRQGGGSFTWNLPVTVTDKAVLVSCIGEGFPVLSPIIGPARGIVQVSAAASAMVTGALLTLSGTSQLTAENLMLAGIPNGVTGISVALGCTLALKNCVLQKTESTDAGAPALRAPSEGLRIEECVIIGRANLGGRRDPGTTNISSQDLTWEPGTVSRTIFGGTVRLVHTDLSGTAFADRWRLANNLSFEKCLFATDGGPRVRGTVDVSGTRNVSFTQCEFNYHCDEDCIYGIALLPDGAGPIWLPVSGLRVQRCRFQPIVSATHPGFISGAGGVGLQDGTGWAIKVQAQVQATAVVSPRQLPEHIFIEDNVFRSGENLSETADIATSPDAGLVRVVDGVDVHIRRNRVTLWTPAATGSSSDIQVLLDAQATVAGVSFGGGNFYDIDENYIGEFGALAANWNGQFLTAIGLLLLVSPNVRRNTVSAYLQNALGTIRVMTAPSALSIITCSDAMVDDNYFLGWRDSVTPTLDTCVGFGGTIVNIRFSRNHFVACGGNNIVNSVGTATIFATFENNEFRVGTDGTKFTGAIKMDTGGSTSFYTSLLHNRWDYQGVGLKDFARLDLNNVNGVIIGNLADSGKIFVATAGGAPYGNLRGYATTPDLNYVGGYS